MEIPVIDNGNKEISDKVNNIIKRDIMKYYEESLKEAESYQDDFQIEDTNFQADVSYEVKKNTSNIISIRLYFYKYSGGAHGYYEYIPYNIDMRKGEVISLKDIFNENYNYKTMINNELNKQIKELENKQNMKGIYDFKGIREEQKFYIIDGNIVVFFDLYDIAPYAAGTPEFFINIDEFNGNIKDDYAVLFQ